MHVFVTPSSIFVNLPEKYFITFPDKYYFFLFLVMIYLRKPKPKDELKNEEMQIETEQKPAENRVVKNELLLAQGNWEDLSTKL